MRQVGDEVVRICRFRGGDQLLLLHSLARESDVLGNGGGEQDRILRDNGKLLAQVVETILANIDAIEKDVPLGGIVEAGKQAEQSALARSGGTKDPNAGAGVNRE